MRILFVLGFANPHPGAAWTRIGFFSRHWSNRGQLVEILGAFGYRSFHKKGVKKIDNVIILNIIPTIGLRHMLAFVLNALFSFIVSTFLLIFKKPNVVIVSLPPGSVGLGALMACKLTRTIYVVDYRDEWEDYALGFFTSKVGKFFFSTIKSVASYFYNNSRLIITVTPSFAKSLKYRGVNNVKVIWNGADISIFKPLNKSLVRTKLGLKNNDFVIVYNGFIGSYYKLDIVIRALAKLRNKIKNFKFIIIGNGPELPHILKLRKRLNLNQKVIYLGTTMNKKEIAEILSAADIGIIPGLYTKGQLPVKFFEYCACGVPIIALAEEDSLLTRFIRKFEIGIITPPGDDDKLAESIYWIYQNKLYRKMAGKRARSLIEKQFDRNKISDTLLKLVEEVGRG